MSIDIDLLQQRMIVANDALTKQLAALTQRVAALEAHTCRGNTTPQMRRPDWHTFASSIRGYLACPCGSILQSFQVTREHWQAGHFDTVIQDTIQTEKLDDR